MPAVLAFVACASITVHAEIIDRLAVTVGSAVITESEVMRQIRLTAFQNGDKPDFSPQSRRDAADKLVEQLLVRREIDSNRYPALENVNPAPMIDELKKRFGGDAGFRQALLDYGLTEDELREQIRWQLTLIPFIDIRFRPGVQVAESDLNDYYENTWLPEWRKTNQGDPPSFADVHSTIENIVTSQRADQALDFWLGQARRQTRIIYHPEAFQ